MWGVGVGVLVFVMLGFVLEGLRGFLGEFL
jgi:hypothetical protein